MQLSVNQIDMTAITLSGLCIVHCLALPVLVALHPIIGFLSEAEWVHKTLIFMTIPLVFSAFFLAKPGRDRVIFGVIAFIGAALLIAAAYVHALHDYEREVTTIGALLIAFAHLFRWRCHARDCACPIDSCG